MTLGQLSGCLRIIRNCETREGYGVEKQGGLRDPFSAESLLSSYRTSIDCAIHAIFLVHTSACSLTMSPSQRTSFVQCSGCESRLIATNVVSAALRSASFSHNDDDTPKGMQMRASYEAKVFNATICPT